MRSTTVSKAPRIPARRAQYLRCETGEGRRVRVVELLAGRAVVRGPDLDDAAAADREGGRGLTERRDRSAEVAGRGAWRFEAGDFACAGPFGFGRGVPLGRAGSRRFGGR
ncbi:MAG: hypothetical protein WCK25_01150 [Actinomycetes bacterium]